MIVERVLKEEKCLGEVASSWGAAGAWSTKSWPATGPGVRRLGIIGHPAQTLPVAHVRLGPKPSMIRYEHKTPGDMIHFDIKQLGRINGMGHRITDDRSKCGLGCWLGGTGMRG